jgi:undecaprenyl diphosphate synthase
VELPKHVGIIPDGNRRWAKAKGRPSLEGHQAGVEALKRVCYAGLDRGIKTITYFAFSSENWERTPDEVKYLMTLFVNKLTNEIAEVHDKNVRFRMLGSRTGLGKKLLDAIDRAEALTADNQGGTLAICLNYGGEQELADAAAELIRQGTKAEEVTPELLAQHLYVPELPPLDLVIRTSGEHRTSGFMMYRAAYAELYFADKHWPDFAATDLDAALADYAKRKRRFGV